MSTEKSNCRLCGQPIASPGVEILGHVFRVSVCEPCQAAEERRDVETRQREAEAARRATWREITRGFERVANSEPGRLHPGMRSKAQKWDWSEGRGIMFVASTAGMTKTRCAFLALRRAFDSGKTCAAMAAVDFAEDATLFGNGKGRELAEARLRDARRVGVLLIDDIDKPKWTPRAEEELFALLDERHRRMRPVIWTSNTLRADLGALWSEERGAAILRRLTDETDIAEVKL